VTMVPIGPAWSGRDRWYGRKCRHCGHSRRGWNGGRRPVEANWRSRWHGGRKRLERKRRRRGWRCRSVLGASLGAECANHRHCKQTNSGERFHGQTLPCYIDERNACLSRGLAKFSRVEAAKQPSANQGVDRGGKYSLRDVRVAIREKSLSSVKIVAPCSNAMAAMRVSIVVRLMPFERHSLKMLAASLYVEKPMGSRISQRERNCSTWPTFRVRP